MKHITTLGIDLAKNVFQLHGVNSAGEVVLKKQIRSRSAFSRFIAQLAPCNIGMEACASAHYWGRRFRTFGHQVSLLHPAYTKAFVERNKNDAADAKACYRALCQPDMKRVPIKTVDQQARLMLEKNRARLLKQRTQLSNQLRGFLLEYGFAIPQGAAALKRQVPELLEDADNELPMLARDIIAQQLQEYHEICERIQAQTQRIEAIAHAHEPCRRLMQLPGVGPISAFVFVAALEGYDFEKGRQAAAWIGLTPKEHSSGASKRLLGISKQGHRTLRCLLIHGARSLARTTAHKTDRLSLWVQRLIESRGYNKAVVALANKTARRAWSMLAYGREYDENFADRYQQTL